MDKRKGTTIGFKVSNIISSLRKGSMSISEIKKEAGLHWETAQKYLRILEDAKIVIKEKKGREVIYTLCQKRNDTLFGLPIDEDKENLIDSITLRIINRYKELFEKEPTKTHIQKILWYVDEKKHLNLPIIWYLYGKTCVKMINPLNPLEEKPLDLTIENLIDDAVKKLGSKTTKELRQFQYETEKNEIYLIKEKIFGEIYKKSFKDLDSLLRTFLIQTVLKMKQDQKVLEQIDYFISIFNILKKQDKLNDEEIQINMLKTFEELWKYTALVIASRDLETYYSKETIEFFIDERIQEQEENLIINFQLLEEPLDKPKISPEIKKFLGSVKSP